MFKVVILFCIGWRNYGIVMSVKVLEGEWIGEPSFEEWVLDNSPYVEDVFWTNDKTFTNVIASLDMGLYEFHGHIRVDDEGDWEIKDGSIIPYRPMVIVDLRGLEFDELEKLLREGGVEQYHPPAVLPEPDGSYPQLYPQIFHYHHLYENE